MTDEQLERLTRMRDRVEATVKANPTGESFRTILEVAWAELDELVRTEAREREDSRALWKIMCALPTLGYLDPDADVVESYRAAYEQATGTRWRPTSRIEVIPGSVPAQGGPKVHSDEVELMDPTLWERCKLTDLDGNVTYWERDSIHVDEQGHATASFAPAAPEEDETGRDREQTEADFDPETLATYAELLALDLGTKAINRSHAGAYALMDYHMLRLKTLYPVEYEAARLAADRNLYGFAIVDLSAGRRVDPAAIMTPTCTPHSVAPARERDDPGPFVPPD